MARTFVHPGYVKSQRDGDDHFVSFPKLCQLYCINPNEVINAQKGLHGVRPEPGDRHLYPRIDGNYPFFNEEENDAKTTSSPRDGGKI